MKKVWEDPRILVQEFTPNEYVAACGDTEYGVYKFKCDAGGGARGDVYVNGRNLTQGKKSYYYACGTTHESSTKDGYLTGTFYYNDGNDRTNGYESIPVIVWTDGGTNVHCTTNLDQDSWEITKS